MPELDHRSSDASGATLSEGKRRTGFLIAALLYVCGLAYGSWLPFELRTDVDEPFEAQIRREFAEPLQWSRGADFLGNAILGLPLGFLVSGALRGAGRASWLRFVPTLCVCLVVSLAIESGQFWIHMRVPAKADVVAQLCGSLAGCLFEYLCGMLLVTQLVQIHRGAGTADSWRRLAVLYVSAYLAYTTLPFDGIETMPNAARRWEEFRAAGSSPLLDRSETGSLLGYAKKVVVYAPLGMLAFFLFQPKRIATILGCGAAAGLLVAVAVELIQLVIASSTSDVAEAVCAAVGAAAGALAISRFQNAATRPTINSSARRAISRAAAGAAVAYFVGLCCLFWYPFAPITDPEILSARLRDMFGVPLLALWQGSYANAVAQTALKTTCFGVLGGLAAVYYACSEPPAVNPAVRVFLWVLAAGLIIEFGQIWSLTRFPDAFDAVLAAVAGLLGQQLVNLLLPRGIRSDLHPWPATGRP